VRGRVSKIIDNKRVSKEGALTVWRGQRKNSGQKESERTRGTNSLNRRSGDKSGMKRRGVGKRQLTNWRGQRKGHVRTCKESKKAGCTYSLNNAERGISQDTERKGAREGNSLPGERVGRVKSFQRKKEGERARGTHKLERAELQVRVLK
jgi:hypothetical protein